MIPRMDITTAIGKEDIPCDRLGSKVLHCIKQPTTTTDKQLLQMLYCTSICYKYCILRATAANVVLCEHLLQILYFTSNCYKYCIVRATATNVVLYEQLLQMLYFTSICYKYCIVRATATNVVLYEQGARHFSTTRRKFMIRHNSDVFIWFVLHNQWKPHSDGLYNT